MRKARHRCALISCPSRTYPEQAFPSRGESLALGYIAAAARDQGHEVVAFDAGFQHLSIKETLTQLHDQQFEVLALSVLSHAELSIALELVNHLCTERAIRHVILGGIPVSCSHADILTSAEHVDSVAIGEGEVILPELLHRLEHDVNWRDTPGIAYRPKEGHIRVNRNPAYTLELDALPFPLRQSRESSAPHNRYWSSHYEVITSRGCPFRCSFCCIREYTRSASIPVYRRRSVANVLHELDVLVRQHGARIISFDDANFIAGKSGREYALELADGLQRKGLRLQFSVALRSPDVDEPLLAGLKKVGLTGVVLGVESGVQRILDYYNKGVTVAENTRAIRVIQRLGLACYPGFIFYVPDITFEEVRQNVDYLKEMRLLSPERFQALLPYPGTPIATRLAMEGVLEPGSAETGFVGQFRLADQRVHVFKQMIDHSRDLVRMHSGRAEEIKLTYEQTVRRGGRSLTGAKLQRAREGMQAVRAAIHEMFTVSVEASLEMAEAFSSSTAALASLSASLAGPSRSCEESLDAIARLSAVAV